MSDESLQMDHTETPRVPVESALAILVPTPHAARTVQVAISDRTKPPRKNRKWIWYFAVLAVLTVIATTTLAVYNIRQQLRPDQLDAAIALWDAKGPKTYVLVYNAKKSEQSGEMNDHYVVKVKDGSAYEVLVNGLPLPEKRQLAYYGMNRLLENIERFMEIDAEPGRPKTYTRGVFDGKTGALAWYVRRVMGSRQRVEITVESLEAK